MQLQMPHTLEVLENDYAICVCIHFNIIAADFFFFCFKSPSLSFSFSLNNFGLIFFYFCHYFCLTFESSFCARDVLFNQSKSAKY